MLVTEKKQIFINELHLPPAYQLHSIFIALYAEGKKTMDENPQIISNGTKEQLHSALKSQGLNTHASEQQATERKRLSRESKTRWKSDTHTRLATHGHRPLPNLALAGLMHIRHSWKSPVVQRHKHHLHDYFHSPASQQTVNRRVIWWLKANIDWNSFS